MQQFFSTPTKYDAHERPVFGVPAALLFPLQPVLQRIIKRVAKENPDMFARLGPHSSAIFIVDPVNLPFALMLRPDPTNLILRACNRNNIPPHDAAISGGFLELLMLIDGDLDGDALFFSRDLKISGNTEAVVCLRNALDDIDGSIAASVADMFGPPGRAALATLRRMKHRENPSPDNPT